MKKLLQNRIVVGLICIVVALVICFGLTPMFNDALKSKVEIVRVSTESKRVMKSRRKCSPQWRWAAITFPETSFTRPRM